MAAYDFPLLIKNLLLTPLSRKTQKEIVYRDRLRFGYPELRDRIGRLGSALSRLGVRPGDTVAVMDWDSHRYLEYYFAVPMLGAVLQTVNVRLSPEQVLYCLNRAEASILICNLSGLRMIIGGSALPRALCEAALKRGIDVFGGYGMSETCPILAISIVHPEAMRTNDEEVTMRMKAGQAIPLVDLRIVDFEMNDVAHDGVTSGEVVVRVPWLTRAYHKNEEATADLWAGGYLHTQDIGVIDSRGYLQVTDRLKDVIKTGGEWVSSLELESIIGQHPAVAEVAVVGLPDPKWGERPAAIVVARVGATLADSDITDQVLRQAELGVVSKYAVPAQVFFVTELPKTSVGKLDKKVLRQRFAQAP